MSQRTSPKKSLGAVVASALFFLVACVPTSEFPILVPGQDPYDANLMGLWYGAFEEDDDPVLIQVMLADEDEHDYPGGMRMIMTGYTDEAEETGWAALYALSAEVNGERYLSIDYQIDDGEVLEGPIRRYHFYHYAITGDKTLTLRAVDEDKLEYLIDTGELKGTIDKGRYTDDIRLTDSSENIIAFLQRGSPDRLFRDEPGVFTRQKPRM